MRLDNIGVVVAIVAFAHVTDAYVPSRAVRRSHHPNIPTTRSAAAAPLLTSAASSPMSPGDALWALPPDATLPEVRKKFRELTAPIHPDAPDGGDEGAFLALTAAYEQRLKKLQRERSQPWLKTKPRTEADEELESALEELGDVLRLFARKHAQGAVEAFESFDLENFDPAMSAVETLEAIDPRTEERARLRLEAERLKAAEAAKAADASWKRFEAECAAFKEEQEQERREQQEGASELQARAKALLEELNNNSPPDSS